MLKMMVKQIFTILRSFFFFFFFTGGILVNGHLFVTGYSVEKDLQDQTNYRDIKELIQVGECRLSVRHWGS